MPPAPLMKSGTRKLSEVAKHLVLPSGIVSSGYPAVEAQCKKMGVTHDDWQQGLGRSVLAKRENGLYAAGIGGVVLSTCRQVGKTFTFGTIIFALCALFPGTTVLWTAHHSRTSDETFDTLAGMTKRSQIAPFVRRVLSGNGKQSIWFVNGSRILFGAREYGFGRGIPGVSIVVFDEAQILKQSALNDMIPAANTVKNPLIFYMGTPPDPKKDAALSEVFTGRRATALEVARRRDAGEEVTSNTLYIELGADADADLDDPVQHAKGNPSYPKRTPPESMQRLREQLGDDDAFRREGLGVWDEAVASKVFPPGVWARQASEVRKLVSPVLAADMRVGLQQSIAFGVAGGVDGGSQIQLVQYETGFGSEWDDEYAADLAEQRMDAGDHDFIVIDGYAENEALILKLRGRGRKVVQLNQVDMANAAIGLTGGLVGKTVWHTTDHYLDASVGIAQKRSFRGSLYLWDRTRSEGDIAPLCAVTAAWWVHHTTPGEYDPMESFF